MDITLPLAAPKLLDQVRGKIRLKHYSIRTEQAYVDWIRRFVLHFYKRSAGVKVAVPGSFFLPLLPVFDSILQVRQPASGLR